MVALVAAVVLAPQGSPKGAELISKMFAYYNDAKTFAGTIQMTQAMMGQTTAYDTIVQFELPSKLFIKQVQKVTGRVYLVTSDGKQFSYDVPRALEESGISKPRERLLENVVQGSLTHQVRDIYRVAVAGLPDRSMPLDVAIGQLGDLKFIRDQWATVKYDGTVDWNGEKAHSISGAWREYGEADVSSTYNLLLTSEGELLRYSIKDRLSAPGQGPQDVVTTWLVRFEKNAKVDPTLFKVVR